MLIASVIVPFLGKAPIARAQAHPRPQQVDDVFHVGAIENGEVGLEPDRGAELAQRQVGEGMKGAAGHRARAIAHQVLDPPQHLLRRAPGEGQQQDRARRDAAFDEPRDAVNQRAGLARAGAGDHQDRAVAMGYGGELRGIEQLGVLDTEAALVNFLARGAQYDHLVGHGATILPRRAAMSFQGAGGNGMRKGAAGACRGAEPTPRRDGTDIAAHTLLFEVAEDRAIQWSSNQADEVFASHRDSVARLYVQARK